MDEELLYKKELWNGFHNIKLTEAENIIKSNLNGCARNFVAIGYYLKDIRDNKTYEQGGYSSIWEYAEDKLQMSKSTVSRFMAINDRFSVDGNTPVLLDEFKDFGSGKLQEMLTLSDKQIKEIKPETTVKEIREMKKTKDEISCDTQQEEKSDRKGKIDKPKLDSDALELDCFNREDGWHKVLIKTPDTSDDEKSFIPETVNFSQEIVTEEIESVNEVAEIIIKECEVVSGQDEVKQEQPELPILRNNDQRKEFIDAYTTWPIWIDQPLTGEKYYRYDFNDKIAMVVKASLKHGWKNYKESKEYEYGAEQYYLLGIKSEWTQKGSNFIEDSSRTFFECSTNRSTMVEYLKEIQKGAK